MADRKLTVIITGDASGATKALDSVGEAGGRLEGKISGLGSAFGGVASVAGGFLLGKAITEGPAALMGLSNAAASLELQTKKAGIVFGDQIGAVTAWADANAKAMGLTTTQATGLAAGLADLLVPMGMTREEAAALSTKTIGLAGALAEWSGGQYDAAQVAGILQKAYLGETDGLKALGISISAADVQARLLAKGQNELTGSALQQAQALAIQELIFEKSTDAQTAFAEGSDSAARKQAEMRAQMAQAREELAMALGPAFTAVTNLLTTAAVPAFELLGAGINGIATAAQAVGPAFEAIVGFVQQAEPFFLPLGAAIGAVAAVILGSMVPAAIAWTAAEIAKTAALLASAAAFLVANAPLIAIALGIGLLVAGIVLLIQHWDQVTAKVPALGAAFDAVRSAIEAAVAAIPGILAGITSAIETALAAIKPVIDAILPPAIAVFKAQFTIAKEAVELVLGNMKIAIETILGVIRGVIDVAMGLLTGDWDRAWSGIEQIFSSVWNGITGLIGNFAGFIRGILPDVQAAGGELMSAFFEGIKGAAGILGDVIEAIGKGIANGVIAVVNKAIQTINNNIPDKISLKGLPDIDLPDDPIPSIPALARGGLIIAGDNPSGIEAIVPLERAREFGFGAGAGGEVHYHFEGPIIGGAYDELIRQIDLRLRRAGRAGLLGA